METVTTKPTHRHQEQLNNGYKALEIGDWRASLHHFQSAVQQQESGEGREGWGMAAWWLDDVPAALENHERAFHFYRDGNDARGAARMATWLALDHYLFHNDLAIANGWFQRAHSLLSGIDPCIELGWLNLWEGHVAIFERNDVVRAKQLSAQTFNLAKQLGDFDLQMLALALEGLALVGEGQIEAGMRRLDESTTAAVSGEMHDPDAIVTACCFLIFACERVRDYDRAAQWCRKVEEVARVWSYGSMFAFCRIHYASVLIWRGDWIQAERELLRADEDLAVSRPGWAAEGALRLGELRLKQGRFDEAAECFERLPGHPLALLGKAELALRSEKPDEADYLIDRFRRRVPDSDRTERVGAIEIELRIQLARHDIPAAEQCLKEFAQLVERIGTETLQGSFSYSQGLLAAATQHFDDARRHFEDAVDMYTAIGAPYELALAREHLARALFRLGRRDLAMKEGIAALAVFERLGAEADYERLTTYLTQGRHQQTPQPESSQPIGYFDLTPREVEVIRLVAEGLSNQDIAARLFISVRTVERHISTIYDKIGASGSTARAVATAYAFEHHLL